MNDPHVVALIYQIEHGQAVDYREAKPIDHEEPDFCVKIAKEKVRFEFKKHHATAKAAQKAIEEYICAWEIDAGLRQGGPNYFTLKFAHAQIEDRNPTIEDRNPTPGVKDISVTVRAGTPTVTVRVTVDKEYPPPPSGLTITPDVRTLYDRYMGCRQGKEPLPSMAYFCLTVIERDPTQKGDPTQKECSSGVCKKIRHGAGDHQGPGFGVAHIRPQGGVTRVDQRGCPPSRAAAHEREPARRPAVTRVRAAGPPLVRLVPLSMRAQPIPVGAGVCGMLRPGAVLVRGRDPAPRGAPLRRGQDLAGRQVHDPVRSPQGARVCVQARSGALRHAGLPLRADPGPGGPSVTPPRIDPRLHGAAVVPPPLIRVDGGIRDRRGPRVGRARLAHLPQPGSEHGDPVPPRASVGVQTTDGRGCPCIGHDPQRLVVCA